MMAILGQRELPALLGQQDQLDQLAQQALLVPREPLALPQLLTQALLLLALLVVAHQL
jgi:hypothetical protein